MKMIANWREKRLQKQVARLSPQLREVYNHVRKTMQTDRPKAAKYLRDMLNSHPELVLPLPRGLVRDLKAELRQLA